MRNKILLFATILFSLTFRISAQISISGQVKDSAQNAIPAATIMLLNPKDSTLVNYSVSTAEGKFSFKNIKKTNYILKISHVSYMPYQLMIAPKESDKEIDLAVISLKPIANFLMEIVIREAKAPILIKGDTVEYDASTFKVPPGSTVEDLLRRLPGIEVDANGDITSMGKDVTTVYVDGKSFFGSDPKTATKNLDATTVRKVQVFDEKTEQEKITGIKDGNREKVMNLELKDEYKKGYFGKISAGYGWGENAPHRWTASGSFNWFNENQQLSFIAYGNNINASNFNWSDYSEFKGQSLRTGNDNGTFGFNSGRYGRYSFSYSYYGGDASGYSQNIGAGTNYNYFNKKIKFNAGYFYSRNYTFSDQFSNRETFLQDSTFLRLDTSSNDNVRNHHNFSTRLEYEIDSSNTLILRADLNYALTSTENDRTLLYQTADFININRQALNNKNKNDKADANVLAIYIHSFKKKKNRKFAMSGNYIFSNGKTLADINNVNTFLNMSPNEQIKFVVKNNENANTHTAQSSLLYVEPLGKMFTLQGFYNFSSAWRATSNKSEDENAQFIDSLQLNYKNHSLFNRIGTLLNFSRKNIDLSAGIAVQNISLRGISSLISTESSKSFSYYSAIPYFSFDIELARHYNIDVNYSYTVDEPSISYLFPMPNLTNNLYKTLGNPDLVPERYHDVNARFSYWNQASMFNVSLSGSANFYDSQIVYNQTTEFVDSTGYVTLSKPENVKGGNKYSLYLWSNFPIVKTILSMQVSINGSIANNPVFINALKNNTNTQNIGGSVGINITAGQKLSFNASGNISATFTKYSIQSDRNQTYMNNGAGAGFKWQVFKKTFLEGNYNFSNYRNKEFAFNQNIHKLNVSVRQVLGKKNQFELRLAAVDLLNQNQYIRQIASINYIEYQTSPTLARYFMLTFAYNLRGFDLNNGRNRMFF